MANKIYIGFSKPSSGFQPFAWLIRKWEGTEYSHVYIRIPSAFLETDVIYQASGLAVNMQSSATFFGHATSLAEFQFDITDETQRNLLQTALSKLGTSYSIRQVLGMGLARAYNLVGLQDRYNPLTDGRAAYVCSELVGEVLVQYLGADIREDLDLITPKDIYEVVSRLGKAP